FSFLGGGDYNSIGTNAYNSFLGGGHNNSVGTNAYDSVLGGGAMNSLQANAAYSFLGGGYWNFIGTNAYGAFLGGGQINSIGANAPGAFLGGGSHNSILNNSEYAMIPGGENNSATNYAFAAGNRAKAINTGAFVWADSQDADFSSTTNNQFNIRAAGGVRINADTSIFFGSQTRQMLNLSGTQYGIGVQTNTTYFRSGGDFSWFQNGVHSDTAHDPGTGGTEMMRLDSLGNLNVHGIVATNITMTSDRNAKERFQSVALRAVLNKVVALPVSEWQFKGDESARHIGPMAQDFYAAFGVGSDDRHIAVVDEGGVALAAIQGLNQKLDEKEARIKELEGRIEKLEQLATSKIVGAK